MKKRGLLLLFSGLCILLAVFFAACASENAANVHQESIGMQASTAQTQPLLDINLKIDTNGLSRPYNARPVSYPSYTADIAEPRVDFTWYKKVGDTYREIDAPPTYVGEYRVTVYVIGGMDYAGEDTVDFAITPAYFKPAANGAFPYTGATVFRVDSVLACGEDRVSYEVAFDSANVGAPISYIRFYGDHAENYVMDPDYTASILPVVLDVSDLNALRVQKVYDATDLVRYTLDQDALSGILKGETATVVFSTGVINACAQTQATATVLRCENPNYVFRGEAALQLTIEKAVFTPPAEVIYTGSSTITLQIPTGLGEDVLTVTMRFCDKNAGAKLLANGVSIAGERKENYRLAGEYSTTIVKRRLDVSGLGDIHVQKRFDGTDTLEILLNTGVTASKTLRVVGTVSQIYPCEEIKTLFRLSGMSDSNYYLDEEFEVYLTVEKAVLKLSGAPLFCYNGYTERDIGMNDPFVSGVVATHPVGLKAVFESDAPDAAFLHVAMYGANSAYYELDAAEFAPVITAGTLRFNAKHINFVANGEDTRVVRGGYSPFLTAIAHGDEVYALLTFSSFEAGATLVEVTLYGADADKYLLDTSDFTAVIE